MPYGLIIARVLFLFCFLIRRRVYWRTYRRCRNWKTPEVVGLTRCATWVVQRTTALRQSKIFSFCSKLRFFWLYHNCVSNIFVRCAWRRIALCLNGRHAGRWANAASEGAWKEWWVTTDHRRRDMTRVRCRRHSRQTRRMRQGIYRVSDHTRWITPSTQDVTCSMHHSCVLELFYIFYVYKSDDLSRLWTVFWRIQLHYVHLFNFKYRLLCSQHKLCYAASISCCLQKCQSSITVAVRVCYYDLSVKLLRLTEILTLNAEFSYYQLILLAESETGLTRFCKLIGGY